MNGFEIVATSLSPIGVFSTSSSPGRRSVRHRDKRNGFACVFASQPSNGRPLEETRSTWTKRGNEKWRSFMFVYRNGNAEPPEMSPEQMQQAVQTWMDWIHDGYQGRLAARRRATASSPRGQVVQPDLTVTDGPFAESKELVGGLLDGRSVRSRGGAVELAKTSPMPAAGGSVEVRELAGHTAD